MSSPVDLLTARLDSVRETERGKWIARCPAHDDKSPSLAIKETTDGVVLMRCFAGCSAFEIVSTIGLELSDLFPKQENFDHSHPGKPLKKPFSAADVLRCTVNELHIVAVCAGQLRNEGLKPEDASRLTLAIQRVLTASQGIIR